jgi:hypothetical protein
MTEYDILKRLEKLNDDDFDVDDIDGGFLSELQQQAPEELHMRIMNSIREEALKDKNLRETPEIRTRNRFNYRKYASFAAAAAIFMVAIIGGAQNILQGKLSPDKISSKQPVVVNSVTSPKKTPFNALTTSTETTTNALRGAKKPADGTANNNPSKFGVTKAGVNSSNSSLIASTKTPANTNKIGTLKDQNTNIEPYKTPEDVSVTITQKQRSYDIKNQDPSATANNTPIANADAKRIGIGSENNPSSNNQTDPNVNNKQNTQDPNGADNNKPTATIDPNNMVAANDNLVNYEIQLSMGQNYNIIQFIKENGSKISDTENIYKLDKANFDMLSQLLEQNGIAENKANDVTDTTVVVKMIIN